ncbi:hypothetical protein SAMN04487972_13220 [Paracoccus halophilus]|uniref:Uncharacterized protein n=1 Tax=Paracoccus halophilus TaxID=376733 RepID=A0A1I0UCJ5_9RHOB|nr:hypothetical protein SAMN04487972_13220 [Paracoccus halophilus]
MGPTKWRGVRQKVWRAVQAFASTASDGLPEMLGVPVDDDRGEEVQPGHAEVLTFGGTIADFTLAADAQGVLQSVVCLALVQADLGPPLHVGIEQPVDDEERPFDPSDFPQGDRQLVLSGIGCELPQELARRHGP